MGFKGDLTTFNLANIFQTLSMNRQTGMLAIFRKDGKANGYVLFEDGQIKQVATTDTFRLRLGEVLLKMGLITSEDLERALAIQKTTGEKLGSILTRMGSIDEKQIVEALRYQQEETLYELFEWDEALFEFTETPDTSVFDEDIGHFGLVFNTNSILMEAMRRLDEWNRIRAYIPTDDEIPVVVRKPPADTLDDHQEVILNLINGINTVRKICALSFCGKFTTCQIIAEFIKEGHVRLKEISELIQTGYDCLRNSYYEEGISILSLVLSRDYWEPEVVERLAEAYRAIGDNDEAVRLFREVRDYYYEQGDFEQAVRCQTEIVNLLPGDWRERMLLGDYYIAAGQNARGAEEYRHARKLINRNENPESFIEVSEKLCSITPTDYSLHEQIAEAYLQVGKKEEALKHLSELAVLYAGRGNYKAAINLYNRMITIAPEAEEYRARLEQMVDLEGRRRKRRLRIIRLCVMLVLVLSVAAIVLGYIMHARSEYARVENRADSLAASGDFDAAIKEIEDFLVAFPFSSVGSKAVKKIEELGNRAARLKREQREREKKVRRDAVRRAEELAKAAKADPKHLPVEKLLAEVSAALEKARYPEEKEILSAALDELKALKARIDSLVADAKARLASGQYSDAHAMIVSLRDSWPLSTTVAALKVPLLVECTLPDDAVVSVNGEEAGAVPRLLELDPEKEVTVTISAPGFEPAVFKLKPRSRWNLVVTLERKPLWSVKLSPLSLLQSPALVEDGKVFVVSREGRIFSLDAATGRVLHTTDLATLSGSPDAIHDVTAASALSNGVLFIPSLDGFLYAVDTSSWRLLWRYSAGDFIRCAPIVFHHRLVHKDVVVFGADDGALRCLLAESGEEVWTFRAKGPIVAAPVLAGDRLFVGSRDSTLYTLSTADGKVAGKISTSGPILASPLLMDGRLYFGNSAGDFYVVDASSYEILSCVRLAPSGVFDTAPVLFGGLVVAACSGKRGTGAPGRVFLVDPEKDAVSSSLTFSGKRVMQPVTYAGDLYCCSSDGILLCYRSSEKGGIELRWKYDFHGRIASSPTSNGVLVIPGERGVVTAFR